MTIAEIIEVYRNKIDYLDLEILIAHSLGKTREFVLTYPEQIITKIQETKIKKNIARRIKKEPIAYIVGHKEFYDLDFVVNKHTLIPRPETELMVENVISLLRSMLRNKTTIIDIGTGSGCIITSIAHNIEHGTWNMEQKCNVTFFGSDVSSEALRIAKKNARIHGLDKKIKFLHGNLLESYLKAKKLMPEKLVITANLPYLSKEIYQSAPSDVKKFEPKSALYSAEKGLAHYRKLLKQLQKLLVTSYELPASTRGDVHLSTRGGQVTLFLEISPEQKQSLTKLIKTILPESNTTFQKDLAGKWRICKIDTSVSS